MIYEGSLLSVSFKNYPIKLKKSNKINIIFKRIKLEKYSGEDG